MQLDDQWQRDEFVNCLDRNFSVIAPAGVGKTTAITERIANFILNDVKTKQPSDSLAKKLVAVTYTEKAANEIRDRVLVEINNKVGTSKDLFIASYQRLSSAFIGTIHAFASKFLKSHCHLIGLNDDFTIVTNDDAETFPDFLSNLGNPISFFDKNIQDDIASFLNIDDTIKNARELHGCQKKNLTISRAPDVDLSSILAYKPKTNETKTKHYIDMLREWSDMRNSNVVFPMPDYREICGKTKFKTKFSSFCEENMQQLDDWKKNAHDCIAATIARGYKKFRIEHGKLTYCDLIDLSVEMLSMPAVVQEIESSPYIVLLDEAQDTDIQQFRLLVGISQHILRDGIAVDILGNFPRGGYFSMVGDHQQSIYCDRARLEDYEHLHDEMTESGCASELVFSVTMRCPMEVVNFVNDRFNKIFKNIKFIELVAKPGAAEGSVEVKKIPKACDDVDPVHHVCEEIANMFAGKQCEDFSVKKWSDISILSPRKEWLSEISKHFSSEKISAGVQLQFDNSDSNKASPIQWLTACLRYINAKINRFEFAGILREIFGIKSGEIIRYFRHGDSSICRSIDEKFEELRKQRHSMSLSKFLQKIEQSFEIFSKIRALGIYSDKEFLLKKNMAVELFYLAESKNMTPIQAEDFFSEKMKTANMNYHVDDSCVQFLTFHKSKGLEWDIVILPFLYRGRKVVECPANTSDSDDAYNNHCRLMYVACTRAKKQLILCDDSDVFGTQQRSGMMSSAQILKMDHSVAQSDS